MFILVRTFYHPKFSQFAYFWGATKQYVLESSKYAYRFLEAALALNSFESVIRQKQYPGNAQNLNLLRSRLLVFYGIRYLCRTYPELCAHCYPPEDDKDQWEELAVNVNNIISFTFHSMILGSAAPNFLDSRYDLGTFLLPECMQRKSRFLGVIIDVIQSLEERHCDGRRKQDGFLCSYIERRSMTSAMERTMFLSIKSEPCDNSARLALSEQDCNRLRCDSADGCDNVPRQNTQFEFHEDQCVFKGDFFICQEIR